MIKNLSVNAGDIRDTGSVPGMGRFPGEGNGNLLLYSCLENPMDRGDWWAIVHRVSKSQTSGLAHIQFSNTHNKYVQQDINFERQILFEGN